MQAALLPVLKRNIGEGLAIIKDRAMGSVLKIKLFDNIIM